MKLLLQKLYKILGSRIALNIYLWLFLIAILDANFQGRGREYVYPRFWYYMFRAITILLSAALLYANNLWLVPRYLVNKKRGRYFLLVLLTAYATGLCYAGISLIIDAWFPKMVVSDISVWTALKVMNPDFPKLAVFFLQGLSWVLSFSILLLVFTMVWYMRDYQRQRRISEEAQKKQVETELNFLKSQINPHFLFNTLNNLYTLTIKKSDSAPDVVSKLSIILRYLMYESNISEVSFEREKEIMHAYIDLELLRLPNKNNMQFSIDTDRPCSIPPLLWVPVLENVFKHGTRFISSEYFIDYRFQIRENTLSIFSKNTFKTIDLNSKSEKSGGIGLNNLKKRLSLLYPKKHEIKITTDENYFIIHIQIQLT